MTLYEHLTPVALLTDIFATNVENGKLFNPIVLEYFFHPVWNRVEVTMVYGPSSPS